MSPPDLCVTFPVELWLGVSHWIPYGANEGGWLVGELVSQHFPIGLGGSFFVWVLGVGNRDFLRIF